MIYCVVKAGQSPLSQLELSQQALSPQSAEQWRAVIYPSALHMCASYSMERVLSFLALPKMLAEAQPAL